VIIEKMNIAETETSVNTIAKVCGCKEKNLRKVTYSFLDSYHGLCIDKRDVILAELEACERLLKNVADENDKNIIQRELAELKMVLDLMP
jgi:hypothetical protein